MQAYFPPINQSEGLPLKIQDVKGKEWSFQFRFWPNNNSRMYVLEGVTPCIQSMQLKAGDTGMIHFHSRPVDNTFIHIDNSFYAWFNYMLALAMEIFMSKALTG